MRISLLSRGFSGWGGGIDFIRYIASSLAVADASVSCDRQLILPRNDWRFYTKKVLFPLRAAMREIARGKMPRYETWQGFSQAYFQKTFVDFAPHFQLDFTDTAYTAQLAAAKKFKADIIFPCLEPLPVREKMPWVGYLYDFQHRHLPHFFTAQEKRYRESRFREMLHRAQHVIVNDQSVIDDARHFVGDFPATLHALPFSPCPQPAWLEDTLDVREKYGLHQPYFMICNQFWRHKNHATAFRAFANFRKQGGDALLVCTGSTADPRFPEYFASLQKLIQDLGMQDCIRILGHMSKVEQISLVKHALAMVQPTLFEGGPGGGAAYDAIALGIPIIASDIPVNKGITVGQVSFFPAQDDAALAAALVACGTSPTVRPSNIQLWQEGLARKKQCGKVLLAIAEQTIKDFTC